MMYMSFKDILFIHWFLGVGMTVAAAILAALKERNRRFFVFGGDVFSWGDKHQWLKWYVFAYFFEFVTSLFYFKSGMMYVELAYSFWQAGLLVAGGFMVDRILTLFAISPSAPSTDASHKINSLKKKFNDIASSAMRSTESLKPKQDYDSVIKEQNNKFEDLLKGH